MYELSGVTCSGKSSHISAFSEKTGIPILKKKWCHFAKGFYFLFKTGSLNKITYIFQKSWRSDPRYLIKAKVLFNCASKFYYINRQGQWVVDEGFVQIPFLLMLSADDVAEFFVLFENEIGSVELFWSSCESERIMDRAIKRGHHRFLGQDASYIESFIFANLDIMAACETIFITKNIRVTFLNEHS